MSIALFGGTFDPFHCGHSAIITAIVSHIRDLSKVLIIPNYDPPHKQEASSSPSDRYNMLHLGVKDWKEKHPEEAKKVAVEISHIELDRRGKSWTIDTVYQLRRQYPDETFWLVIGSDSYFSFHHWWQYKDLLLQVNLAVINRDQTDRTVYKAYYNRYLTGLAPDRLLMIQIEPVPVSSTEIRENARQGKELTGQVPEPVARYMMQYRLYHQD